MTKPDGTDGSSAGGSTGQPKDYENPPNVAVVVTPLRQASKLAAALKLGESQGLQLDCLVVDSDSGALAVREVPVVPIGALSAEDIDSFDFDSLSMDDLLGGGAVSSADSSSPARDVTTGQASEAGINSTAGTNSDGFDRNVAPQFDPSSAEALAQFVSTLLPGHEVLLLNKVASKVTATRWSNGQSIGTVPPGLVIAQLDNLTQALVLGTSSIHEVSGTIDPATYTAGQTVRGLFNPFKKKPKDTHE